MPPTNQKLPALASVSMDMAIWEVYPQSRALPVYMKISRTPFCNLERFVVVVNSAKFYDIWLNSSHSQCPGQYRKLSTDYKFNQADRGFSRGKSNPIPLAQVSAFKSQSDQNCEIQFTDGITRTIWLLHHLVGAFPIETHSFKSATLLSQQVGVSNLCPISVGELLSTPDTQLSTKIGPLIGG